MTMRFFRNHLCFSTLALLFTAALAHAASITGTVTNKTTGKPSAGDSVVLVDVQAGMADAATATTNSQGKYSLQAPGMGPYLIRVNHQGATYFIAAPQGGTPGDVTVFDVAPKLDGVGIDADMLLVEAAGGMLRIQERYLVRNRSLPPKALYSSNTFEVVLPDGAELDGASATRPGGLATNTRLVPLPQKEHYTFNIPIQPDNGEKETMFEVQYHISYSGKFTFSPHLNMPADNLVVYTPKTMTFSASQGSDFQSVQEDPRVQTNVAKNIHPGQAIGFSVSGEGQMPRDAQSAGTGKMAGAGTGDAGSEDTSNPSSRPGGGIGTPIGTPDPLTRYKWWILGGLALLLAAGSIFLLRNRGAAAPGLGILPLDPPSTRAPRFDDDSPVTHDPHYEGRPLPTYAPRVEAAPVSSAAPPSTYAAPPATGATLLSALKDELFAIESEKLSGTMSPEEYAAAKAGLEAVLKRALKK